MLVHSRVAIVQRKRAAPLRRARCEAQKVQLGGPQVTMKAQVLYSTEKFNPASPSVVISGASSGIGKATAQKLASEGWNVFAGVRSPDVALELEQSPLPIMPLLLDVQQEDSVQASATAIEELVSEHGLQGLVNNAGVACTCPVESFPMVKFQEVMDINLFGSVRMVQTYLPLLRKEKKGRIINIGSLSGTVAYPMFSAYACSKFALEAFSDSLRYEVADQGVKVILIKPGGVKTNIWDRAKAVSGDMVSKMSELHQTLYGHQIKQISKAAQQAEDTGVLAEDVAEVVHEALTAPSPRARYGLGQSAIVQMTARRLLPDWIWDKLLLRGLDKIGAEQEH